MSRVFTLLFAKKHQADGTSSRL